MNSLRVVWFDLIKLSIDGKWRLCITENTTGSTPGLDHIARLSPAAISDVHLSCSCWAGKSTEDRAQCRASSVPDQIVYTKNSYRSGRGVPFSHGARRANRSRRSIPYLISIPQVHLIDLFDSQCFSWPRESDAIADWRTLTFGPIPSALTYASIMKRSLAMCSRFWIM